MERQAKAASVDEYISRFDPDVQQKLKALRKAIKARLPGATERISYQIPAFWLNEDLVYFAAFKDHISFFPTSAPIAAFKKELKPYKWAKGTVQFPLDEPLPLDLIERMVDFRVAQAAQKAGKKAKKAKARAKKR